MNEWIAPRSVDLSTRTFYQIIYHTDALPVEPQFFRKDPDTGQHVLRDAGRARQQDDDRRADLQAGEVRAVERNASGEDRHRCRAASLVLHDVIDTRYNNDGFLTNQQHVKSVIDRTAARRDGVAVRQPGQQRSLDDEQQVAAHAGQRAAGSGHRRHRDGQPADQSCGQARVAVRLHHRRRRRGAARAALRKARAHARHRALDHRVFRRTTSWFRRLRRSAATER